MNRISPNKEPESSPLAQTSGEAQNLRLGPPFDFGWRNPGLLRATVFGCAVGAYLIDRDDVVWAIAPWHTVRQQFLARCVFASATVLVLLAAALRTWAKTYESNKCNYEFDFGTQTWRADGPFRHVRYPLALGDLMFVAGVGSLLSCTGFLIAIVGMGILTLRAIRRGECALHHVGPQAYSELCDRVPRLLPSISARIHSRGAGPRWRRAFRTEASGWACCLMLFAFSITLRDAFAWAIGGAALALALFLNSPLCAFGVKPADKDGHECDTIG